MTPKNSLIRYKVLNKSEKRFGQFNTESNKGKFCLLNNR